ncbi:MAG: NAD(P)H-dependent glycerol-3-phosphate dehydrogenase [Actinomycetota bacterium]|jgi:glycerol-3-phosphate dehydrogenase (NAD(P)+)
MTTVAVLGAGAWGTTFAKVLADAGNSVQVWARRDEIAREINETHRNTRYLQRVNLPLNLTASSSLPVTLAGAEAIFLSVPSQSLRGLLEEVDGLLGDEVPVVSLMKGVERSTGQRMSEVIADAGRVSVDRIAVLSGPNLALEIAKEEPSASVVASENQEVAAAIASMATNHYFTSLTNNDVIGTEFGGVLKNLIAVAVGIADGVGYGDNTKASIITRGLAELSAFAAAYGAKPETMWGLAGLGDLIATCESPLSRNNTAGRLLGQGYSYDMVIRQMDQTAEGLGSVDPILNLAKAKRISMPIVTQVQQVLRGTLDPRELAPHLATDKSGPAEE